MQVVWLQYEQRSVFKRVLGIQQSSLSHLSTIDASLKNYHGFNSTRTGVSRKKLMYIKRSYQVVATTP